MKTKLIVGYSTNRDETFIKKFNKEILKSSGLKEKKEEIDIIPIFNSGEYSLTQAYNMITGYVNFSKQNPIGEITNTVVVFIHHDIHFKTQGWGKNLLNIFNNNDIDIVGLAGTDHLRKHCVWWLDDQNQFNKNDLWGKVWHTDGKKQWKSDFTTDAKKCAKLQPVVAIDGVFIAFDPDTCVDFDTDFKGFHLYDISFCIENLLYGRKIAVTETIQIVHESGGQLSIAWEENRAKLAHIYEHQLPMRIR